MNDEPIVAGRTGFEPVDLFADNEAATLAASRPSRMFSVHCATLEVAPAAGFVALTRCAAARSRLADP